MGKKIRIILLICLSGVFLFANKEISSSLSRTNGIELSVFGDIVDEKESYTYYIETTYISAHTATVNSSTENYTFDEMYVYHQKSTNLHLEIDEHTEQLVLIKDSSYEYYHRIDRSDQLSYNQPHMPFFKSYDASMYLEIIDFWNNPMFGVADEIDNRHSLDIDINDLNENEINYIKTVVEMNYKTFDNFKSDYLNVFAYTHNDKILYIEIDYSDLLGDGYTLKQKITIEDSVFLNTAVMIDQAIDLNDVEQNRTDLYPFMEEDEVVSVENDYKSKEADIYFINIDQEGQYKFSKTSDSETQSFPWYLYDLEGNELKNKKHAQNQSFFEDFPEYIYLYPGTYYVYLSPRSINCNQASLSYTYFMPADDQLNSISDHVETMTSNQELSFDTEYLYDVDIFKVSGDYDYLIISNVVDTGVTFGNLLYEEVVYMSGSYIIEKPLGKDILLYFSGTSLGEKTVDIKLYKESDDPISFEDAPMINIYSIDSAQLAFPFTGNKDRFSFLIAEDSQVYVGPLSAKYRIYDINLEVIDINQEGFYDLTTGTYYIEIYEFTNLSASVEIISEKNDESIHVLSSKDDRHRFRGFVSSPEDIDLYQFTLEDDTTIQFEANSYIKVLIYGIDNPFMATFDIHAKYPYFIPAGTYNLTLPYKDKLVYDFEMIIGTPLVETEFVDLESFEVVDDVEVYTYQMSFDFIYDVEKIMVETTSAVKLELSFPVGLRVNIQFTNQRTKVKTYYSYTITDPVTYIQFSEPGEVIVTFDTSVRYSHQELTYGNFEIKMYLLNLE